MNDVGAGPLDPQVSFEVREMLAEAAALNLDIEPVGYIHDARQLIEWYLDDTIDYIQFALWADTISPAAWVESVDRTP